MPACLVCGVKRWMRDALLPACLAHSGQSLPTKTLSIETGSNAATYTALIPKVPKHGCPTNTAGCSGNECHGQENCFCEEHCTWKTCRLLEYPAECLKEVKSTWKWDSMKGCWVAQVGGMMTLIFLNDSTDYVSYS